MKMILMSKVFIKNIWLGLDMVEDTFNHSVQETEAGRQIFVSSHPV